MDILYLVDRLEEIIKQSKPMPFGGGRLVDESKVWPILDQMRISIPDEVRRAERIVRDKERVMAQAHEEAERITSLSRSEAAKLSAEHAISQAAEGRARMIRERAEREANLVRAGADDYAFEVLCRLEQEMRRALTVIENGIQTIELEREKRSARVAAEHEPPEPPTP
ncbi:MAG: hypothetical protein GX601_17385 [Anaerolineales bacterium]|nr:hypothetical protein [Anaerolineales bacterium]